MKFLALKQALEKWESYEKNLNAKVCPIPHGDGSKISQQKTPIYRPRTPEKVVGGTILWKPIDKIAALLIARPPWWAYPPQVASKPKEEPKQKPKKKEKRMSLSNSNVPYHPAINPNEQVVEKATEHQMSEGVAKKFVKQTMCAMDETNDLLNKAIDARAAMDALTENWKASWIDFMDTTNDRLREMRMTRMAVETEMRQLMASLREVRAFFLDKNHDVEIARLKDFVETCERLQRLKESGFLDTVADTMLKLSSNP